MVSPETRRLFEELDKDMRVVSLHLNVFQALYAGDPADVDLLNAIAPGTFWVIHESLQDSIVLPIARMTDPSKTGKLENLTLESLIEAVEKDDDIVMAQQLREKYKDVATHAASIRALRNKVKGHTDRPARLGVVPVPSIRLDEMVQAVRSIGELLNIFASTFHGRAEYALSAMDGEAEVLLCRLREAEAYRQEVPDWHLLGNPRRQQIRDLLKLTQSKNGERLES